MNFNRFRTDFIIGKKCPKKVLLILLYMNEMDWLGKKEEEEVGENMNPEKAGNLGTF